MKKYLIDEDDLVDFIESAIQLSVINYQAGKENSDIIHRAFVEYLEQYAITQKLEPGQISFNDIARTHLDLFKRAEVCDG